MNEIAKHLWEADHPYYCTLSDFLSGETQHNYESWGDFLTVMSDSDMDYNLVFRWDWYSASNPEHEIEADVLQIFIMQQRKGKFVSAQIQVDPTDEPAVIEWLRPRLNHLMELWQPLSQHADMGLDRE